MTASLPRVIRIIARLNVGGPARHVVWLTDGLKTEFDTTLVAGVVPAGEDDMGYFAAAHGIKPLIMKEMSREISPRDAVTVIKLWQLFRRLRPDIVHTHTAKAGTVGRVAGWLYRWLTPAALIGRPRRVRFVHTYHGHIFHSYYGRAKTRAFLLIEQALARLATDRIITISPQQRHEIHKKFGVGRAAQLRVIPLGLDLSAFDEWAARRPQVREELGADNNTLLVGIVGRLAEIKHHALFLESAALFCAQNPTLAACVRFVIIGDGHLRGALEQQADALNLTGRVMFTGSRHDAENFYPALDVVALTSRNEGTPLTLIEAMANARPVLSTAVGGVIDLLGAATTTRPDGFTICERGLSVSPDDAAKFATALAYLLQHTDLQQKLGAAGREFVTQHYRRERLLEDVRALYRELISSES